MSRPPHPRKVEALALLRLGVSTHRVHQLCDVPLRTVEAWSAALGLRSVGQYTPRPLSARAVRALELLLGDYAAQEIADHLGISRQAVQELRDRWL